MDWRMNLSGAEIFACRYSILRSARRKLSIAYRAIGESATKLNARACVVVASGLESVTPEWIHGLAQPILEQDFDLVAPCYARKNLKGF